MGCLSSIFLIFVGYLLLGKWGAVLGLIVGVMLSGTKPKKLRLNDFGAAFLQCMAKIAKADGRVSEREAALIGDFIHTNYPPQLHSEVRKVFNAARDDDKSFEFYCDRFAALALLQLDYNSRAQFLLLFCSLAVQDGRLDEAEKNMLFYAERALRLSGVVETFFRRGKSSSAEDASGGAQARRSASDLSMAEAYAVLDCTEKSTDDELKKAYRRKCSEFHPDRLQGKGLPKQFLDYAEEQMKKINLAYDLIRKTRG